MRRLKYYHSLIATLEIFGIDVLILDDDVNMALLKLACVC